jgi:hypothetical protein
MSTPKFSYPSKVQKFKIEQINLKFVVAKYENEITWQSKVKNEDTLIEFIQSDLLPKLISMATWPLAKDIKKHYFAVEKHLNLDLALRNEHDMSSTEFDKLKKIHSEKGPPAAVRFLCTIVNKKKSEHFSEWVSFVQSKYPNDFAFQLLILRPIFESAGFGSRRSLSSPSEDIIDWIFLRIQKERITPKSNLAREYFIKSAFGSGLVIKNGWQYIKRNSPARKLMAAAQGSGWCIRDSYYASHYLNSFDFYILRSNTKPVVALRVNPRTKQIVECVDPHNRYPFAFLVDIFFFMETLGLLYGYDEEDNHDFFMDRIDEMQLDHKEYPEQWWKERMNYWPFIVDRVPKEYVQQQIAIENANIPTYLEIFPLHEIEEKLQLKLTIDDFESILMIQPELFEHIVSNKTETVVERLKAATIKACVEKIEDKSLTLSEIEILPEFVKVNEEFRTILSSNLPKSLMNKLKRAPKNYKERLNPTLLENILPYVPNESLELSITRAQQSLMLYQGSNFSDSIFSQDLRDNPNFAKIREQAWLNAIRENPTFYFALPTDLRKSGLYLPEKEIDDQKLLDSWIKSVEEKPWILTSKTGVPKAVRYHEKLLSAYITGWMPILYKNPSRIWKSHGNYSGTRAYLSYPALKNKFILNALIEGLIFKPSEFSYSSGRMKLIPNYLMAALIAANRSGMLTTYNYLPKPSAKQLSENDDDPVEFYTNEFLKGNRNLLIQAYSNINSAAMLKLDITPPTSVFVAPSKKKTKKNMPSSITKGSTLEITYNGRNMLISIDVDKKGYVTFSSNQMETKLLKGTNIGGSFKIGSNTIQLIRIFG